MKIPELFRDYELICKCGCGLLPDIGSVKKLYAFRLIMDKPIIVTSGARCRAHNKAVGGAKNSPHLIGAFDLKIDRKDEYRAIMAAQSVGFTGIGINDNTFMHLDDKRDEPAIWTY